MKNVYKTEAPVCAIWTDLVPGRLDLRRVILVTPGRLLHFIGTIGRHSAEGHGSIFAKLFDRESPMIHEPRPSGEPPVYSSFAVTPEAGDVPGTEGSRPDRIFAWLSSRTITHGKLSLAPASRDLGSKVFNETRKLSDIAALRNQPKTRSRFLALTQWHILQVVDNRVVATNRLDDSVVYNQVALPSDERPIALLADPKKNTFWLFTIRGIYEIVVRDEDRDIWKVMMKAQKFEEALQYANNAAQKDSVTTASGDYLTAKERYMEAAGAYGKSSKPFEEVSLMFIEKKQKDALRRYLLTKLSTMKKSSTMQRIILTSWLTEIFMSKLNSLDDMVMTKGELTEEDTPADVQDQLHTIRREYHEFIRKYRDDLDRKTIYDIISSHGREEELLFFSAAINDYNYVLSYWVQRENWSEALKALNKQTDPDIIYKYSSVLMAHAPVAFIDIIIRQTSLDPRKLIPACLNYNKTLASSTPLAQNQAIRYLNYEINQHASTDAAVHNTLLSIYASHPSSDESPLLAYLESQSPPSYMLPSTRNNADTKPKLPYDADFALRLCIQHARVNACVHIYSTMGQYVSAVTLALQHGQTDVAVAVAERPEHDAATRKKLWLAIAKSVIAGETPGDLANAAKKPLSGETPQQAQQQQQQPKGLAHRPKPSQGQAKDPQKEEAASISTALSLLRRAPPQTLRIEDLLPLLPSFVHIDAFRDEILSALQSYATEIASLRTSMDESAQTAARINDDVGQLGRRWVLLEPGEGCAVCGEVLLERRFWVWGCGHGVHGDCVAREVVRSGGKGVARRVREIRGVLEGGGLEKGKRERLVRELDEILGRECLLCGEVAVRRVDEPFVTEADRSEVAGWAL